MSRLFRLGRKCEASNAYFTISIDAQGRRTQARHASAGDALAHAQAANARGIPCFVLTPQASAQARA